MKATLVGGDRLGNIPTMLHRRGISVLRHISGREATDQKRINALPRGTDLLILFTDFLSHNAMHSFRRAARAHGVPVVASRRAASSLELALVGQPLVPSGY
jgi:hypothetical protein